MGKKIVHVYNFKVQFIYFSKVVMYFLHLPCELIEQLIELGGIKGKMLGVVIRGHSILINIQKIYLKNLILFQSKC